MMICCQRWTQTWFGHPSSVWLNWRMSSLYKSLCKRPALLALSPLPPPLPRMIVLPPLARQPMALVYGFNSMPFWEVWAAGQHGAGFQAGSRPLSNSLEAS